MGTCKMIVYSVILGKLDADGIVHTAIGFREKVTFNMTTVVLGSGSLAPEALPWWIPGLPFPLP